MCGDANLGALENSVGLGLVNLGFLPHLGKHYVHTLESEARIKELATRLGMRICIATDSDGLFVDGSDVQPFGNIITVAP